MSTEQQRQQWRELADAAQAGPLHATRLGLDYGIFTSVHECLAVVDGGDNNKQEATAMFFAAARAAVPALLADVDALTQERDKAATMLGDALLESNRIARERDALAAELEQGRAIERNLEIRRAQLEAENADLRREIAKLEDDIMESVAS